MTARAWRLRAALLLASAGCYQVGYQPAGGMRQIAVPVFTNRTLRRDLEVDLTRHVRREVLETTPLHLAGESELGVPVLRGTIAAVRENVLVAGAAEEVLEAGISVTVTFGVYRAKDLILGEDLDGDGSPDAEVSLDGFAEFSLPRGESREGAADEVLRDLAEMIVARLQERQDDRWEQNDDPSRAREVPLGRQLALRQRDDDWFRAAVPPGKALEVTLAFSGANDLVLRAADKDGQWLPDVQPGDGGRTLRVPALEGERAVLLRVSGPDDGRPYTLALRLR